MSDDDDLPQAEAYDDAEVGMGGGDTYSEVSHESWFQRLGNALVGVLIGGILFLVAFPLLWWNEGNSVRNATGLSELGGSITTVPADRIDAQNDKKPVHVVAEATTEETLTDPVFPVSARAIKLRRKVEMYQWQEKKTTETHKRTGGGTEKRTKYTYNKVWSDRSIDSGKFHHASEHVNPPEMRFPTNEQVAQDVKFGAFTLSNSLLSQMNHFTSIPVTDSFREQLAEPLKEQATVRDGVLYLPQSAKKKSVDPEHPVVGDLRITFENVKSQKYSVAARQSGSSFEPWTSKTNTSIERLMVGEVSADQMVSRLQSENKMITWLLRGAGAILMGVGIAMVLNPLQVFSDVLPFIGSIVGVGISIVSALIAGFFSLTTIGLAWIFYRPLLGILLLAAAVGFLLLIRMLRKPKPQQTFAPARA